MTPLEPLLRELVGEVLRRRRRAQRRTLAEVAARAGMSMQHLSDVERGRKDPSSEIVAAICGALGLSLGQLMALVGELAPVPRAALPEPALDLSSDPRADQLARQRSVETQPQALLHAVRLPAGADVPAGSVTLSAA